MKASHDKILIPSLINKRERMKELLINEFKGKSILYNIIEERGELHNIFTERILDMDPKIMYSTQEVAEICETPTYNINNKRKEFTEYINPQIIGGPNSRNWKHDYIAVFKLKMIDYLTGQDGIYTLKQIKQLLYGHYQESGETAPLDTMYQVVNQLGQAFNGLTSEEIQRVFKVMASDQFQNLITNDKTVNPILIQSHKLEELEKRFAALPGETEIENRINKIEEHLNESHSKQMEEIEQKLANLQGGGDLQERLVKIEEQMAKSQTEQDLVIQKCSEVFEKIKSPDVSIRDKEELLNQFDDIAAQHKDYPDIIRLYQDSANERLRMLAQEKRQLDVIAIKEKALLLYEKSLNDELSMEEREKALSDLNNIKDEHQDIRADIMIFITQARKIRKLEENAKNQTEQQEKGFFARIFSGFKGK